MIYFYSASIIKGGELVGSVSSFIETPTKATTMAECQGLLADVTEDALKSVPDKGLRTLVSVVSITPML